VLFQIVKKGLQIECPAHHKWLIPI
jgi:hypothetical protein